MLTQGIRVKNVRPAVTFLVVTDHLKLYFVVKNAPIPTMLTLMPHSILGLII
jgi:hypothetical protein